MTTNYSLRHSTGYNNAVKLPSRGIIIGTWNFRTLYGCGRVPELDLAPNGYRWDVIGLCETRWTNFGETTTNNGHKIMFSGDERKHQHGVRFIVRKEALESIISYSPISSRLISIRIAAKPHNLSVIQVYAPTTDYDDNEVEEFYDQLEEEIKGVAEKNTS